MILGIDLGTTGCKAVLFTASGKMIGESYLEYGVFGNSSVEIEQDADKWWLLTKEAVRLALKNAGIKGTRVRALSVSSQGIAFVLISSTGKVLSPAFSWLDTRAKQETDEILNRFSFGQIFQITGKRISPVYVLPKLLWIRKHAKKSFDTAAKFVMGEEFLINKFTGICVTDHSMAAGTLMYDVRKLCWSNKIVDTFNIPREKLPTIQWAGTPIAKLQNSVAKKLGLSCDTMVVLGGQDQKCAAYGAGIKSGIATVSLGTAAAITVLVNKPIFDKKMRIPCFPFVQKNQWVLEAVVSTGGASLKWMRELLVDVIKNSDSSREPVLDYYRLDELAKKSPVGANRIFFYPHLSGASSPHWNEQQFAEFSGISLATKIEDFVRAVMEGVAFEIKLNLDALEAIIGRIDSLYLFGGGAKSNLWCSIITNVTNKPSKAFELPNSVANIGAACLAKTGLAQSTDKCEKLRIPFQRYMPQDKIVKVYRERLKIYKQFYL